VKVGMGMPAETLEHAETALIEAVRRREAPAFAHWVASNDRWVHGVVYGVLGDRDQVDDVAQQVWLTAWQRIETLSDPRRWRTWLYAVARNAALDAGRRVTRRRRTDAAPLLDDMLDDRVPPADAILLDEERRGSVLRAVEGLPALYREPFVLRHLEGWSYRQIAEVMDMPVDSVETRLVRAMRMLRQALSPSDLVEQEAPG